MHPVVGVEVERAPNGLELAGRRRTLIVVVIVPPAERTASLAREDVADRSQRDPSSVDADQDASSVN